MLDKTRTSCETPDLFSAAEMRGQGLHSEDEQKGAPEQKRTTREPVKTIRSPVAAEGSAQELYLRDTSVAKRYDVSRQTVWRWTAQGKLPKPVQLSENVTRWLMSDLLRHEASLPKGPKAKMSRKGRTKAGVKGGQQ